MRRKTTVLLLLTLLVSLLLCHAALADAYAVSAAQATVNVGSRATLTLTRDGRRIQSGSAQWSTSDAAVATVDGYGHVKGVAQGTATVTARFADGSTVESKITVVKPVTRVTVSPRTLTIENGKTVQLTPVVLPEDATDKALTVTSSKPEVADVSASGLITARSAGRTVIRIASANGKSVTVTVRVTQPALGITLPQSAQTVFSGRSVRMAATLAPSNVTTKKVTYTTSDKTVATVSSSGVVYGKKGGTAVITATAHNGLTAQCTVTVEEPVRSIRLAASRLTVDVGATAAIAATALPESATDKTLSYKSSDERIARVDAKTGAVTGVKAGRATITVTATSGRTARCTVTVTQPVTSITLPTGDCAVDKGKRIPLKPVVGPADATVKKVTYTTSDPTVASVSTSGQVLGRKAGTAVITATASSGLTAQVTVTVREPVTSVRLGARTLTVETGKTADTGAQAMPATATDKTLSYKSSNPAIAQVNPDTGLITGVKAGTAYITATSVNGRSTRLTVKVVQPVTSITNPATLTLDAGRSKKLPATVLPADATDKKVKYTSSDPKIATVSSTGQISGRKAGVAVITATASNGLTAMTTVTVTQPVTRVAFSFGTKTLGKYEALKLEPVVAPADATDPTLTFTVSNPTVATVTPDGVLTGRAIGTTTVTATARSGRKASFTVTVKEIAVTSVSIERYYARVTPGESFALSGKVQPSNASDKKIVYSSSNPAVATVDANGKVTAVANGTAMIAAASTGTKVYTQTCKVVVAAQQTKRLTGVIIGLNPGHQLKSNAAPIPLGPGLRETRYSIKVGAQGKFTRVPEYEVNLRVAMKLRDLLEAEGATVIITRTSHDVNLSNIERANIMNSAHCDVALQLHCNGSSNPNVMGLSFFVKPRGEGYAVSKLIAEAMQGPVLAVTGAKDAGLHVSQDYPSLNWSTVPSVLIEMGYMSNPVEDRLLATDDYQALLAEAIVEGLVAYFGK